MSAQFHFWLLHVARYFVGIAAALGLVWLPAVHLPADLNGVVQWLILLFLLTFALPLGVHFLLSCIPAACSNCQISAAYRQVDAERGSAQTFHDQCLQNSTPWTIGGSLLPIAYVCSTCEHCQPTGYDVLV